MDRIRKLNIDTKGVLKQSIFGAFYTLWTAPIDNRKLTLPSKKETKENLLSGLLDNLIIGHTPIKF